MADRMCGNCKYLKRTSPEQVFLLCDFWSRRFIPQKGTREVYDYSYVVGHCHMQPDAPACAYFRKRRFSVGTDDDPESVLAAV